MLSIGVLVDLQWSPNAGGQVKTWERFADAAKDFRDELRLTLHFQGERDRIVIQTENVRYITLRPLLSTKRFRSMNQIADHTDLSPFHFRLLPYLKHYDVVHTTDAFFAQAKTALFASRRYGTPLVNSIHTDTPGYTKIYSAQIIRKIFGNSPISRLLLERFHLDDFFASSMNRRLQRFLNQCQWILVSKTEDMHKLKQALPGKNVSILRRGFDDRIFHPNHKNRRKIKDFYGIDEDRFLLLFVGRVDHGKNVMTLAKASRLLLEQGEPIHVIVVGEGSQKSAIEKLLGPAVTFTGNVPQSMLSWLYASANAFVFPSEIEVCPNVVIEARASGLPVLVPSKGGAAQLVREHGEDGIVIKDKNPRHWADAINYLIKNPERCKGIGKTARRIMETEWPSWKEVLVSDLLPVWRRVAAAHRKNN